MTQGQLLFYYQGNLNVDQATEISRRTRELLNLQAMAVSDLPDVRSMKLISGQTLVYESLLLDELNGNSCSLVAYQGPTSTEKETTKSELISSMVQ